MENTQHIKSLNTDARGKNRIRFASARQRSERASADIYRSYKRRIGVTSAATREERVHHHSEESLRKRSKRTSRVAGDDSSRVAIVSTAAAEAEFDSKNFVGDDTLEEASTFAEEVDLAHERNASELFGRFYRTVWPLVRSLPEVLHHAPAIIELCMAYLLSPASERSEPSPGPWVPREDDKNGTSNRNRQSYVVNLATTDILHLLSVLAKELRHEIHKYLHPVIIPRIIYDLLNPPPISGKQPVPLDVTVVEAAFRTLSYIFRYDTNVFEETANRDEAPCLEPMRQYYGATLAHKRDYVRRLAAETFSPLIRKLPSDSARKRHLKRVIRALAKVLSRQSRQRVVSDAIDGVSLLLCCTARGVQGQLHSKGHVAIKCALDCVGSNDKDDQESKDIVYNIARAFLEKLSTYVGSMERVWKELFKATDGVLSTLEQSAPKILDVHAMQAFSHMLKLLDQSVSFNNAAIHSIDQAMINQFLALLERVFLNRTCDLYEMLTPDVQTVTWGLLCSVWRAAPDHENSSRLCRFLPKLLSRTGKTSSDRQVQEAAEYLATELLPSVPRDVALQYVGTAVLKAAAQFNQDNPNLSLALIHSVATCRLLSTEKGEDDDDSIFFVDNAVECKPLPNHQFALLDVCLIRNISTREDLARLGCACRCIPFLALIGERSKVVDDKVLKRITQWFDATMVHLDTNFCGSNSSKDADKEITDCDLLITKALVLETLATISKKVCSKGPEDAPLFLKKSVSRSRASALGLLVTHPSSVWAVKSVSSLVAALADFGLELSDSPNDVIDILIPNLRHKSHFLRLHTLEILCSFPPKPFVTNYADLDLTDELDEEPVGMTRNKIGETWETSQTLSGPCDILATLLSLESSPVNLDNERHLTSLISRVEVLGRTGRLPVAYAEAASNHMFGILHTKFSSMWPFAVRALVALATSHEDSTWPSIEAMLEKVTVPCHEDLSSPRKVSDGAFSKESFYTAYHRKCVAWEKSNGSDARLFSCQVITAGEFGRVSRHQSTDTATIFELVWSVMEGAPHLTTKKSKVVVPIFLRFLHLQYFLFHRNDPEAAELRLEDQVEEVAEWTREDLTRRELKRKLSSFLQMFAVVNGPQQLYKHAVLQSIYWAFLSHQDVEIAQLALSCVLKFKLPQLMPYADHLNNMLKKGELREALVNFDISRDSGVIEEDHRATLFALMSRMLFGRLAARVSGAKSSKDSPSARRAAVLSFLSVLGDGPDLYPFIFLMIRIFVPVALPIVPIEKQSDDYRDKVLEAIESMTAQDLPAIGLHQQRQEGFLNLLSDVIAQLGYGVEKYVPTFMSIILSICELTKVRKLHSIHAGPDETGGNGNAQVCRDGTIRTLCFQRMEEVMAQYAFSHDFSKYSQRMWRAVATSVRLLPGTVVNSEKAPALLRLLVTLSAHHRLIPTLVDQPAAVEAVLRCIAPTSRHEVVDASLKFIDNLLSDGMTDSDNSTAAYELSYDSGGVELVRKHIPVLIKQFADRIEIENLGLTESAAKTKRKHPVNQITWRQLAILCRVSEIIVHDDAKGSRGAEGAGVFASLCGLLIPFLGHDLRANEDGQLNVLNILSSILPRVEASEALSHLAALSRVLGPHKSGKGITSLRVRQRTATVIATIADGSNADENLKHGSIVLGQLCSLNAKRVDEADYDQLIPALNGLSDANATSFNWLHLAGQSSDSNLPPDLIHLLPLIQTCFHFLYDDDGVVSRGAFKALKTLILLASEVTPKADKEELHRDSWLQLMEKSIVPFIRLGLGASSLQVRRLFILLLAEVSRCFEGYPSPNLYGDLGCLVRTDDPDLDFFKNLTHVQIHRRCRALQRLRKTLCSNSNDASGSSFTMHSMSNVLLPLAMHPIYECQSKAEEPYVLEAIATVGTLAKRLSWNKYNNTLWTALMQFPRHPEQERFLVGMICSLIDGFHFDIVESESNSQENECERSEETRSLSSKNGSTVWRTLERRLIPKIESFLSKEKVDRSGSKVKILRSPVVLTLLKLLCKFPEQYFESRLPRLLAVTCDALKNRESDARDAARSTLAKMAVEVDRKYLLDIIREVVVALTEGYQLHVRSATIHSILLEISKTYKPPSGEVIQEMLPLPFDRCLPALIDVIQQDLFGEAAERKEAEGVQKRVVKEASGSKSVDSIELMCRMLLFKPSIRTSPGAKSTNLSSIHVVVTPLLNRLRESNVSAKTIGKVTECLNRVVVGLSRNPSAVEKELFPFVYATIEPFVREYHSVATEPGERSSAEAYESSDDENGLKPMSVSRTGESGVPYARSSQLTKPRTRRTNAVVVWHPSTVHSVSSENDAHAMKLKERKALGKVQDGASAPRLTGNSRFSWVAKLSAGSLNDPAAISSVTFCLSLLSSALRRTKKDSHDDQLLSMMDGFISILTICVSICRDKDVILLALKCLASLLRFDLPSVPTCSTTLGTKTLDLLTSSGALSNLHHELTQGCFKTLTLLLTMDKQSEIGSSIDFTNEGDLTQPYSSSTGMPLDTEQMKVLLSLLKASVVDMDHHHATFSLIKAISSRKFISVEFYDLMETMLELSVRSQKVTIRQLSSQIFLYYLLEYPMRKIRLEGHLKQMVLNIQYEHEEGRLSAIGLVSAVIDKFPLPLLEEQAQLLFLPLVLQLVNDGSKECREAVAKSLMRLLSRVSLDVLETLYDYAVKWSSQGKGSLQRTSLQMFGVFVDARPDFLKRGNVARELISRIHVHLKSQNSDGLNDWEVSYFSLVCLDKVLNHFPTMLSQHTDLWPLIVDCLVNPHPWVQQVASRLLSGHLQALHATSFADKNECTFLNRPGSLFDVAQNLCLQLNVPESEQNRDVSTTIKSLTWVVQAMDKYPHLCFAVPQHGEDPRGEKAPLAWLMTRLSNMAKPKGEKRRVAVFKSFAAFTTFADPKIVSPYLDLMLEPLHRCIVEADNAIETAITFRKNAPTSKEGDIAKNVLHVLEEHCGTEGFLEAYASVKVRAREKKEARKQKLAVEAVQDPQVATARKMKKHQSERKRRKRKAEERRLQRGGTAKRRHVD